MSDTTADSPPEPAKRSKLPMIIGLVLMLAGAGGGFFAVQSGLLPFGAAEEDMASSGSTAAAAPLGDLSFVEVPPLLISLGDADGSRHLRFRASLEVPDQYATEVAEVLPRVQDVLNSYLRALQPEDLTEQSALIRLRAQMLRRVKLVLGEERVRDLLVLEFVLT